jgi:polysaccharide biosynthesis transport protein
MLQATRPAIIDNETAQDGSPLELIAWALGVVRRQFLVMIFIALPIISLAALYVLTAPPTYTAEATILIDPRKVQLFPGSTFAEGQADSPTLESQVELLKSERVGLAVVKKLGLSEDPEFIAAKSGFAGALAFASHLFALRSEPLSESEAVRAALGVLAKNLTVARTGVSYFITVKYRAANPDLAAQIANAIAEAYIADQLEAKNDPTRRAGVWLQQRIEELKEKRALADRRVVDFKKEKNMVVADGKLVNEQQIAELNSQLTVARQKIFEAKAHLDRIDAVIRDGMVDGGSTATVADALSNQVVIQLRTRYLELVNREADYSRKYGANHLAVVNLRDRVRELRGSILDELKRLRESYLSNYEIAKQREQDLEKSLAAAVVQSQETNQAQVALRELESTAQTYRTMHDNFLQRYTESLQQESFPISEARIITPASPPGGKSGPKGLLILAMAMAGGLALGVGAGVLRDLMNGSVCTAVQAETALQAPCIAIVPSLNGQKSENKSIVKGARLAGLPSRQGFSEGGGRRTIARGSDVMWAIVDSPFSRFAEAIRGIKLAVDLNGDVVNANKVIGFTSSIPNEGKSTIAASLALLMAQVGARVILVDCDLRNPTLSRKLAPNADCGLLDVIVGTMPLEDAIWRDASTNLAFLPAGIKSRLANSSEIFAAESTQRLFSDLRSQYDYVLVDLSPLMPIVDTRATTGLVGSYICVIEWGCTTADVVKRAFKDAENIYENLIGVVLNKADINRLSSYDSVGGNYYRNKYYAQYGFTE